MKSQNALYKEFLELKESHKDYKFCEASVVGRDAANPLSAFVLNRGSNDGIAVNDPVIYGKYLVGVVTSVTLTQCTIKLYSTRASTPAHMRSARATSALSQRLRHTPRTDSAPCPVFRAQRRSPRRNRLHIGSRRHLSARLNYRHGHKSRGLRHGTSPRPR